MHRYNIEKEYNNWPSFVDLMTAFVFVLILVLVFAKFSIILFLRAQRMQTQKKIKKEINYLKTKSGTPLTCDNPELAKINFHIYIPTDDLFDSGSDKLNDEKLIAKLGVIIKKYLVEEKSKIKSIAIKGHSDIMPLSKKAQGKYYSNLGLSAMRAVSVQDVFVKKCNIDPRKILVEGIGEYEPKVYPEFYSSSQYPDFVREVLNMNYSDYLKNSQEKEKAQKILAPNRRIEVVLIFEEVPKDTTAKKQ